MTGYYPNGLLSVNIVFVGLLVAGLSFTKLGAGRATVFVVLWLAGYVGLPHLTFGGRVFGAYLFVPYVVLLDAILAIVVCKAPDEIS